MNNTEMITGLSRWVSSGGRSAKARKTLYQTVARKVNGVIRMGNRKRLPRCVENNVRKKFPSKDGEYTGYKEK